jgi:hypothetical protein
MVLNQEKLTQLRGNDGVFRSDDSGSNGSGGQDRGRLLCRIFAKLIFGATKLGGEPLSVKQALYPPS